MHVGCKKGWPLRLGLMIWFIKDVFMLSLVNEFVIARPNFLRIKFCTLDALDAGDGVSR